MAITQTIGADRLFDGAQLHHNAVLTIRDGVVLQLEPNSAKCQRWFNGILAPGFIDLQVNGGADLLLNDNPTEAAIAHVVEAHLRFGTTTMLPTVITDSIDKMNIAADAVALMQRNPNSGVVGIHFEGPHINYSKRGAHNPDYIRSISTNEWQIFSRTDLGSVLLTIAPEQVSPEEIQRLTALGVTVFLGHSNASYQQAQTALQAGAVGFTHLYNAMSPLQGREPGMVGAAFLDSTAFAGIIVDGHHVDYASVRLAFERFGADRLCLVTDAMPPVGGQQTQFELVGNPVTQRGDRLIGANGELAGSVLTMAAAVANCVDYVGCSIEEALKMATSTPAAVLGLVQRGSLTIGSRADLVWLDERHQLQQCWRAGEMINVDSA